MRKQLVEVFMLSKFVQSIGQMFEPNKVEPKDKKEQEKLALEIVKEIFSGHGLTLKHADQDEDSLVKKYTIKIGKEAHVVKMVLLYGHGSISITLWDDKESDLLDVLIVGDLKDRFKLRALGKDRLKKWSET